MNKCATIAGILLIGSLLTASLPLQGQDSRSPVEVAGSLDLVSRYLWRGIEIGQAPSIQPGLSVSWKGFTLGGWGAYKMSGEGGQETDFYLSGEFGFITVALWDYWCFDDRTGTDFFNYREPSTSHLLEAQVVVSGGDRLPLNLLASYFFYGADPSRSLYLELQFRHETRQGGLLAFAGYQAKGSFYGPESGLVNIGCTVTRPIPVTDRFALPLNLSLIVNPMSGSAYLVAGLSLSFSGLEEPTQWIRPRINN
ncbi:MAG: TorF family putative porin [Bacteroidales bacterium]